MIKYQLLLSYTRQYKAIFKENLVFYLGFVAIATLTTLSRYFHALTSKFQAQFCSQSDKLESEAKLNNYFIWCLSHFSSLPCLIMYEYCMEKITLYVPFLGIILVVFSLEFTLKNIETLANKNCSPQYHTQRITTIMLQVLTINIIIIMINYLMNPDQVTSEIWQHCWMAIHGKREKIEKQQNTCTLLFNMEVFIGKKFKSNCRA